MLKIGCTVKMGFTSKLDLKLEELVKKLADQYDKLYYFKNVELQYRNTKSKKLKVFTKILKENGDIDKNYFLSILIWMEKITI